MYLDQQWPIETTEAQLITDLHQAVLHPQGQIWTYRYYDHAYAAFLAPSHVQQAPQPEPYLFVAYSPVFGTITTGYQASGSGSILSSGFTDLVQHR